MEKKPDDVRLSDFFQNGAKRKDYLYNSVYFFSKDMRRPYRPNLLLTKIRRRLPRNRSWRLLAPFLFCLYLGHPILFDGPDKVDLPDGIDHRLYEPLEPQVTEDFPRGQTDKPKIPRIIHQTWRDTYIPSKFRPNIESFIGNNPDWEYYLWTDDNARSLIKDHHPALLPLWDDCVNYDKRQRLFNIIRYVILYVYGGVFVDMDTINYRSLDTAITKYSCIIPVEPFEHVFRTNVPYTLTHSVMFCRPGHPFFRYILDNLHMYEHLNNHWDAAGPGFFTTQYKLYMQRYRQQDAEGLRTDLTKGNSYPYFYHEPIPSDHPDAVYIASSQYFTGLCDSKLYSLMYRECKNFHNLHFLHQKACVHLQYHGLVRGRSKFTYIQHLWQNNWYAWNKQTIYVKAYRYLFGNDIREIVPHVKIYQSE